MTLLFLLAALAFAEQPRLSADGRTLVYVDGELLVRRLLPSGDETAVKIPGLVGAPLASGDGNRALVQSSHGRLSVDLQTGAAVELPPGLEPVSAGGVDVFRTRLGPLQAGETVLEPGFHSAAADPYRKLALLASDTELAVWDARKGRIVKRRAARGARILGPGLIAADGAVESVDLPSLERKVLWRGPYAPSSYARAPDALYLVTERPRTLRKVYLDGGGEAWALPWTEQPVALLGFGAGQLYLSDGETVWNLPPEPAKLSLFKEELSRQGAGASLPPWLLLAALAAGVLLLLRLARELRGPSYRRR